MKNTIVQVTCDICGKDADVYDYSVQVDTQRVSIDLCADHRTELDKAFGSFLEAGRKERNTNKKQGKRRDTKVIRDWAKSNGHDVSARGRIPQAVEAAFNAKGA